MKIVVGSGVSRDFHKGTRKLVEHIKLAGDERWIYEYIFDDNERRTAAHPLHLLSNRLSAILRKNKVFYSEVVQDFNTKDRAKLIFPGCDPSRVVLEVVMREIDRFMWMASWHHLKLSVKNE